MLKLPLLLLAFYWATANADNQNSGYDSQYGVFISKFKQLEFNFVGGQVYAINESAIQILNFNFTENLPDTFFWLDLSERPTRSGVRLRTFEYGYSPIGAYNSATVVLILPPDQKITQYRSLSLFCLQDDVNYGSVAIPENFNPPKSQILSELQGSRYKISGIVQVWDTRTIKIIGFNGYFYVGQGPNVTRNSGVKAAIRGRDTFDMISPMSERYTGGKDIFVELPDGYDIQHIDFLAIYSFRFDLVYAYTLFKNIGRYNIPPFVPAQKRFEEALDSEKDTAWNLSNLLGTATQKNFTFQLGPSGGRHGYQVKAPLRNIYFKAMHKVGKAPQYVWYVNGYMANLYLKRGITYTFIVEGGRNQTTPEFYNPLYLTNSSYGAYSKLSNSEKQYEKIYAPENVTSAAGRLCRWMGGSKRSSRASSGPIDLDGDSFSTFTDFRATLRLKCDSLSDNSPAVFTFTPSKNTPQKIYFQSYNNYEMGSTIFVVDEFPADLKHIVEEPAWQFDAWQNKANLELTRENSASISYSNAISTFLFLLFIAIQL